MSNDPFSGIPAFLAVIIFVATIGVWIGIAIAASNLAPHDRSTNFFWATLLVLGPLGLAAAFVAQPRDTAPGRRATASGRRRFICPRCAADNDIPESDRSYDCWRCSEHRTVQATKKEAKPTKSAEG
jgi:hypothetical protein